MESVDFTGMQNMTTYSPARIAMRGIFSAISGLLVGGIAVAAIRGAAGMPMWWRRTEGMVLAFAALWFIAGGIGCVATAFARDCYFKAGPDGIAVRLPRQGWFGLYRLTEYRFRWEQIKPLAHSRRRFNSLPIWAGVEIKPYVGKTVAIERYFFAADGDCIQQRLSMIRALAGR